MQLLILDRENAKQVFANRSSWDVIDELLQSQTVGILAFEISDGMPEVIEDCLAGRPLIGDDQRQASVIRPDLVRHFSSQLQSVEGANIEPLRDLYQQAAETSSAVLIVR